MPETALTNSQRWHPSLQRVHILGAAGSGKTTLASWCAEALRCPWHELDTIAYEGGYARKCTLEERLESLAQITSQPSWVTEGGYLWWIGDLLDAADAIVWLDLPWTTSMRRIVTRHVELSWAGQNRHPGIRNLLHFVWNCRRYYLETEARVPEAPDDDSGLNRPNVVHYLTPYMGRVSQCIRPADVDRFKARLVSTIGG